MSLEARLGEAVSRSRKHLPAEVAAQVAALFTPTNLAIMAATLAVWAGSHFAGVGFIADIILLCLGVVMLGWTAVQLAGILYDFCVTLVDAKSDDDLERAGALFAQAAPRATCVLRRRPVALRRRRPSRSRRRCRGATGARTSRSRRRAPIAWRRRPSPISPLRRGRPSRAPTAS
jgi:hypothetical protein